MRFVSDASPIYFPELHGPSDRYTSLDLSNCRNSEDELRTRFPILWDASQPLLVQSAYKDGDAGGTVGMGKIGPDGVASGFTYATGTKTLPDGSTWNFFTWEFDLAPYVGKMVTVGINALGTVSGSTDYFSWPILPFDPIDPDFGCVLEFQYGCGSGIHQGINYDAGGFTSQMYLKALMSFEGMDNEIERTDTDSSAQGLCLAESTELYRVTTNFLPLWYRRKLSRMLLTPCLSVAGTHELTSDGVVNRQRTSDALPVATFDFELRLRDADYNFNN